MGDKDLYATLELEAGADLPAVKRAYRRLAFAVHPDVGSNPDPARFHQVHEAYEALSRADYQRAHEGEPIEVRRAGEQLFRAEPIRDLSRRRGEPLRSRPRVANIPDDFANSVPSLDEFLDHVAQNFFGFHRKSRGPLRRLGVEVVLNPDEARYGCRLPLELPIFEECTRCRGFDLGWGLCPACHGYGLVQGRGRVVLNIPAGIHGSQNYELSLESIGIANLRLDLHIRAA